MQAAVDADIVFKGVVYGLAFELITSIPCEISRAGCLGATRFVLRAKLRAAKLKRSREGAMATLEELFHHIAILEPTPEETSLAANLEFFAQKANLDLDEGESLLCAIVVSRCVCWLATGDKRAVEALERLLNSHAGLSNLAGRVICLEQLMLRLLASRDTTTIRDAVCAEAEADRALSICFGCYGSNDHPDSWIDGLKSYVDDLRRSAGTVLAN